MEPSFELDVYPKYDGTIVFGCNGVKYGDFKNIACGDMTGKIHEKYRNIHQFLYAHQRQMLSYKDNYAYTISDTPYVVEYHESNNEIRIIRNGKEEIRYNLFVITLQYLFNGFNLDFSHLNDKCAHEMIDYVIAKLGCYIYSDAVDGLNAIKSSKIISNGCIRKMAKLSQHNEAIDNENLEKINDFYESVVCFWKSNTFYKCLDNWLLRHEFSGQTHEFIKVWGISENNCDFPNEFLPPSGMDIPTSRIISNLLSKKFKVEDLTLRDELYDTMWSIYVHEKSWHVFCRMNNISDKDMGNHKRTVLSSRPKFDKLFVVEDYLKIRINDSKNGMLINEFLDDPSRGSYKHLNIGSIEFNEGDHQLIAESIRKEILNKTHFHFWQDKFSHHYLLGNIDNESSNSDGKILRDESKEDFKIMMKKLSDSLLEFGEFLESFNDDGRRTSSPTSSKHDGRRASSPTLSKHDTEE